MAKLHELLAVEPDKEGIAKRILSETKDLFRKNHNVFTGGTKLLKMDKEGNDSLEASAYEHREITTTVSARLDYTFESLGELIDITYQKEATNQLAKADVVVDGEILISDAPVSFLLNLEKKLKDIRGVFDLAPTLSPGVVWEEDPTAADGVFRTASPEIKAKTQKVPQFRVLYEATKEHPAEIEKWNEDVVVGKFTTTHTSGMISSHRKAELLTRVDKLLQATKQARMRANESMVATDRVSDKLFNYLLG